MVMANKSNRFDCKYVISSGLFYFAPMYLRNADISSYFPVCS